MKLLPWILVVALVLLLVLQGLNLVNLWTFGTKDEPAEVFQKSSLILQKVEALGKFEVIKYNYQEVIELELALENRNLLDMFSSSRSKKFFWEDDPRVLLIAVGEAVGCIDLSQITANSIKEHDSLMTINLPEPELCYVRIDQKATHIYAYEDEDRLDPEGKLIEHAYKVAEANLTQHAIDQGILRETKIMGKSLLEPMLSSIAGKPVVLSFTPVEIKLPKE